MGCIVKTDSRVGPKMDHVSSFFVRPTFLLVMQFASLNSVGFIFTYKIVGNRLSVVCMRPRLAEEANVLIL